MKHSTQLLSLFRNMNRSLVTALSFITAAFFSTCANAATQELDYKSLYQQAAPAVVMVYGSGNQYSSTGTGSIITKEGLVLTNAHVVYQDKAKQQQWQTLRVILKPQKVTGNDAVDLKNVYNAKLVAAHKDYDLALLKIENPPAELPTLTLSDLSNVDIGESVIAIGHPSGGAKWTLTTGRLSASWNDFNKVKGRDVFQTETAINPGNSGGPLLDGSMSIIGINSFIVRKNDSGMALTGLNYAVKSSTARNWIESVTNGLPEVSLVRPNKSTSQDTEEPAIETDQAPTNKTEEPVHPRIYTLPKSAPKEELYHSKIEPGLEYPESQLDALQRRIKMAFDELDKEVDSLPWDHQPNQANRD